MLTDVFWKKMKLEMRLLHIIQHRPSVKVKLQPINEDDFSISLETVTEWSSDNIQLYHQILQNGMAQFICNKDYLLQFYRSLTFIDCNIEVIDPPSQRFTNIRVLNLTQNRISSLQNIPANCKQLYLDFNQLASIQIANNHHLELLSVSHNYFTDSSLQSISKVFTDLRCLNISFNQISNIKQLVTSIKALPYLKILVAFSNPISMLKIYYSYITENLALTFIDGNKFVEKEPPKIQEKKQVVVQKKDIKQEKKDAAKKDAKKGAKVQEKPPQQPPQVDLPKPIKLQLTQSDFEKVKLQIIIKNLQQHSGNVYDPTLFPPNTDPKKTQTCYWLSYYLIDHMSQQKQKIISFENSTTEGDEVRLNLECSIFKEFTINSQNLALFNNGLKIYIHQIEPKMIRDSQTFQLKPEIKDNDITMIESILGGIHVDFRSFHFIKQKEMKFKFRLFSSQAVNSPLFYDPFQNQAELIKSKQQKYELKLKSLQESKIKKQQQEQLLIQQKKGKDSKKATDKKATKKEGKDIIVASKVKSEKCNYPIFDKLYTVVENGQIFKGKELLCVEIKML